MDTCNKYASDKSLSIFDKEGVPDLRLLGNSFYEFCQPSLRKCLIQTSL